MKFWPAAGQNPVRGKVVAQRVESALRHLISVLMPSTSAARAIDGIHPEAKDQAGAAGIDSHARQGTLMRCRCGGGDKNSAITLGSSHSCQCSCCVPEHLRHRAL